MRIGACLLILVAASGTWPSRAEEGHEEVTGGVEVGYREVQVGGNEDKYREDVNLADNALRLFEFDFAWLPEKSAALDDLTIEAQGLGGEPHESINVRSRKTGLWDLKASYGTSSAFYRDAGYFFREGGDLHGWDSKRTNYGLDFKVRAARWLTLRALADRTQRDGPSTTSRTIQRDVFVVTSPMDWTGSAFTLGADLRFGWADLTLEHRLATYENRRIQTAGPSGGEDPGGASLDEYYQEQVQKADTPWSRIVFAGRPADWLRFSAGYARARGEMDYRVDGAWAGFDYDDAPSGNPPEPFTTSLTNAGTIERAVDLYTADVSVRPAAPLEITLEGSRRSYEQDGSINSIEEQIGGKDNGTYTVAGVVRNEVGLDAYGLTARWDVTRTLSLSAGVGNQSRTAEFQLAGPEVTTKRSRYRAGVRYRAKDVLDLRVEAEKGSDDDPYTPASPTDVDRALVGITIHPGAGVGLALRFKDESRKNGLLYPLGLPTDDTPPVTEIGGARFDLTSWGTTLTWSRGEKVDLAFGYDRTKIDSDAEIVYVTGSTFVPVFDVFTTRGRTAYVADQEVFYAQARFVVGRAWSFGVSASRVQNEGTFPVNQDRYGAEGRYRHGSGFYVRLAFDRYGLDETNPYAGDPAALTPNVNDYDADLWTVAVGYRF